MLFVLFFCFFFVFFETQFSPFLHSLFPSRYGSQGSLDAYLRKQSRDIIPTGQLLGFCLQICSGVQFLIEQGVYHHSLQASNCLLTANETVKINGYAVTKRHSKSVFSNDESDIRWSSPESLSRGIHDEASVVWSLGVTFWEIFSMGARPLADLSTSEVFQCITSYEEE